MLDGNGSGGEASHRRCAEVNSSALISPIVEPAIFGADQQVRDVVAIQIDHRGAGRMP